MPIVATLHMPSLNLVGLPSIVAAMVVLFLAGTTTGLFPLSADERRKWTMAAPIVVFSLVGLTLLLAILGMTRPLDADDFVAVIIYVVAGFVFAMQNLRYTSLFCRVNAGLFGLLFGAAIVFLAVGWRWGEASLALTAVLFFCLVWLSIILPMVSCLPADWRTCPNTQDRPDADRFQFTLRGLLAGFAVVAVVLGLSMVMLDWVKQRRLAVDDFRLRRELQLLSMDLGLASIWNGGVLRNSGDQIFEHLESAWSNERRVLAYFESAGLDFDELDAFEAVVFWLAAERVSETPDLLAGGDAAQGVRPDWPALLQRSRFGADPGNLVDRDDDGWPELIFKGWAPEYPAKVFRLEDGEIVAWDMVPDQTAGIRKGYAEGANGLETFEVVEDPP